MINQEYDSFPLRKETELIIGIGFEIHNYLGGGFMENVYKDAFEYEFDTKKIDYTREKVYKIKYKDIFLRHNYFADFVVWDKVILEIKSKNEIPKEDLAQTINYLKCSGCKVALILNFRQAQLQFKRVIF
ncbi:MAG: GxxExxY protein [Chitinophagales bacterium]